MQKVAYKILFGSLALTILLVMAWVLGYFFAIPVITDQFYFWLMASMFACLGFFVGIVLLMMSSIRR